MIYSSKPLNEQSYSLMVASGERLSQILTYYMTYRIRMIAIKNCLSTADTSKSL